MLHKLNFGQNGEINFQTVNNFVSTDLVGITADCDEQAEGRASREHGVVLSLFSPPAAMLESVAHHTRVTVIPGIEMESNVGSGAGATL